METAQSLQEVEESLEPPLGGFKEHKNSSGVTEKSPPHQLNPAAEERAKVAAIAHTLTVDDTARFINSHIQYVTCAYYTGGFFLLTMRF